MGDFSGAATSAGNATTLNSTDLGATPTATHGIYPGMVIWNKADSQWAVVQVVSANSLTTSALSGSASWDDTEDFLIKRGGLNYSFTYANAEFFVIDTRYKRDPNNTTDGDM